MDLFPDSATVASGELVLGGVTASELAREFATPLVVFCDSDVTPVTGWLAELRRQFEDPAVGVAGPRVHGQEPQPSDGFTSPFAISEAPEELIVATFSGDILQACYAALEIVATREPKITAQKSTRLKFKANFSMKRIFCQMTEIPITVFSMAMTADPTEAGLSPFFIRMPFTISEFKREIQRPM